MNRSEQGEACAQHGTARGSSAGQRARAAAIGLALVLALGGGGALGCAGPLGGIEFEELSDQPIAFVYWDAESARRRHEIVEEARGARNAAMPTRTGVATPEGIATLFGRDPFESEGLGRYPGRITLLNPRTGELRRFPGSPVNARPLAWSSDRKRLLFTSAHAGAGFQIYEYDLETDELRALTRGSAFHLEGDYAPDDRMVLTFIEQSAARNAAGMSLVDAYGADLARLVDGVYPSAPRVAPTGDRLIWVRSMSRPPRSGHSRDQSTIVSQRLEFSEEPTVLTRGREPSFLPDGSGFVYSSEGDDGWKLHRMRIDGGGRTRIGVSIRDERNPAVSPDGRHVVYVSPGDDGIERLYVRRVDGSGDRVLLGEGGAAWPVW